MACLSPTVLHPQGKNIKDSEFNALGDMLAQISWELPQVQEYKNDLVQPAFLTNGPAMPQSTSQTIVPMQTTDPNGPCTPEQWAKVSKMVA
jgi:hypothetical protein